MPDHTCTRHQPGSNACYTVDACRCTPCLEARARTCKAARVRRDTGRGLTPAGPVRDHVARLRSTMSLQEIADMAGLTYSTLQIAPERHRVQHRVAVAIMSVLPITTATAGLVPIAGTRRRLRALAAIGWSQRELAPHFGVTSQAVWQWMQRPTLRCVTTDTRARAIAVYNKLWDQPPPADTPKRQAAVALSIRRAKAAGWAPPMAWDDDQLDQPDAQPDTPRKPRTTIPTETLIEAAELGCCLAELCTRFNLKASSVERSLDRVGRHDLWVRIRPADMSDPRTRKAA